MNSRGNLVLVLGIFPPAVSPPAFDPAWFKESTPRAHRQDPWKKRDRNHTGTKAGILARKERRERRKLSR